MIETLEQAEENLLRERSAQAMKAFGRSVRPIYAVRAPGPNPVLVQVGSCILLNIDQQRVMSTAAHVLDELVRNALFVGGPPGTRPVPIEGGILKITTAPQGDRDRDYFDCAFWKIPEAAVSALGAVMFLDGEQLAHNRAPADRRYYMAMGYAASRNKDAIDKRSRSISNQLSRYSGRASRTRCRAQSFRRRPSVPQLRKARAHRRRLRREYVQTYWAQRRCTFGSRRLHDGVCLRPQSSVASKVEWHAD